MSKKQIQDILKENANLKLQVSTLSSQIADLNENTVISSMNEMKERYDKMIATTVCLNKFLNLKYHYTRYFNLVKTVDNVTCVIRDDVINLIHFLDYYNKENGNISFSEETKKNRLTNDLKNISNRLLMVIQLSNRDEDEWSDAECDDDH